MDLSLIARDIFADALSAVNLRSAMRRKVTRRGSQLRVGNLAYDLQTFAHIAILAIGKAAVPMAEGLMEQLNHLPRPHAEIEGLVVGATLPASPHPGMRYRLGCHPLPDESALGAGELALELLHRCDRNSLVFFLVSGGSSAMLERPLIAGLTLGELAQFHNALVHSGLPITEMNALRKHLSAPKGGRLAKAAGGATMCTLVVSDVPAGSPEIVGSGPSLPDHSTREDCRALLAGPLAEAPIPKVIRDWFASSDCPETPKPEDACFLHARHYTLLSSDDLIAAAKQSAEQHGLVVHVDQGCDEWDYLSAADHLLRRLDHLSFLRRPVCLISAGELAVKVHGIPGRGGRNQQFALACAQRIAGSTANIAVLSAGTDGIDGNSPAAGAAVDRNTVRLAASRGLAVVQALASFNAYPLLDTIGQTVVTGPTGNNLRDLRLLLLDPRT